MSRSTIVTVLMIAAILAAAHGQTVPQPSKELEAKLIGVLQSGAPIKDKAEACRQLGAIGTKDAVAPLAALLSDEKLSHMARYALETIPDPAVEDAFRAALGTLKGRPLVGVIGSCGVRRDAKSVAILAKLLGDADADVAQAAARAMGKIGGGEAAKALTAALASAPAANQLAVCEGLFRCAEGLATAGQKSEAMAIYDKLRGLPGPHQVRSGAVRGAILVRGKEGITLLQESLKSSDYITFSAAVQAALEVKGPEATQALVAALKQDSADRKVLLLRALGERGDATAMAAVSDAAKAGDKTVRRAAIGALARLQKPAAVPVLAQLQADEDRAIAQAAQEALASLPGSEADAAVQAMLGDTQAATRLIAIDLIGRRRMMGSLGALLKTSGADADAKVRAAAIRKVGEMGGASEMEGLAQLLMQPKSPQDIQPAEQALGALCGRAEDRNAAAQKLVALMPQAQTAQKGSLLRILGTLGGSNALAAVRAAAKDADAQVAEAAVRALCQWPNAEPADDVLAIAKSSANASQKLAALRGYITMTRDEGLSSEKKLAMCKQAAAIIERDEERRLLLGVLGTVASPDALAMAMAHLDNNATKGEAASAAVAVAERIVDQNAAAVVEAMPKVLKATNDRELAKRARAVLDKAKAAVK